MIIFDHFLLFLLNAEAGVNIKSYAAPPVLAFEEARKKGWSDDPRDAGGATMCGVTLKTFRSWCLVNRLPVPTKDILHGISFQNWRSVVKEFFWDLCKADKIYYQPIAYIIVDWVWASGPSVIKHVQRLVGVCPDGIVGSRTLAAINAANQRDLFDAIKRKRVEFIESCIKSRPANACFRKGWLARLDRILPDPPFLSFQQKIQPSDFYR